tara:strand:+ start:19691 stop:20119 length:429 start_codon:yes stop_codon:yes gene_type:complete
MSNNKGHDAINRALDVKAEIVKEGGCAKRSDKAQRIDKDDPTKDYEYTRAQLYNLIEKGHEALNGILDVAADSQHPRAYEVAGQLIKSVGDVTDKLLDSQKKMKDMDEDKSGPKQVTNNSLFVGSTSDLQKMLKEMSKKDNK